MPSGTSETANNGRPTATVQANANRMGLPWPEKPEPFPKLEGTKTGMDTIKARVKVSLIVIGRHRWAKLSTPRRRFGAAPPDCCLTEVERQERQDPA